MGLDLCDRSLEEKTSNHSSLILMRENALTLITTSNILIPLVGISPKIFPESHNLSKISWTAVSTDSHSTLVITSNVECITTSSWGLEVIQSTCMRQC